MAKFTVLKNNGDLMKRLGYFSHETLTTKTNEFFKSPWTYYIFFTSPAFIISSSVFIYQNAQDRINIALRTAIVHLGECQSFGIFTNFGMQMKNVKTMHLKLQKIVNESAQGIVIHDKKFENFETRLNIISFVRCITYLLEK